MLEIRIASLKNRGINPFQAVIMAAREARSMNRKVVEGILQLERKPSTEALQKLADGRLVIAEEDGIQG